MGSEHDFKNTTKRQHYISQTELSFFSVDEDNYTDSNKIYQFKVVDLKQARLGAPKSLKIRNLLCFYDLYTFAIDSQHRRLRYILESSFKRYEDKYKESAQALTDLCSQLTTKTDNKNHVDSVFSILYLKFLNIFRNPFSVSLTKRLLGPIWSLEIDLSEPQNKEYYRLLNRMSERECAYHSETFDISIHDYKIWLRVLFFLLCQGEVLSDSDVFFEA